MGEQAIIRQAEQKGHQVKDHPVMAVFAGAGFVTYGLVYVLMGWLALQLAFGDRAGAVSKNGALHQLAETPLGKGLLWAAAVGCAGLVVRTALKALIGHRDKDGLRRLTARGGNVVQLAIYSALGFSAAKIAMGSKSKENPDGLTAKLFQLPLGTWIVAGIGVAVTTYAAVSIWRGLTNGFEDDIASKALTGRTGTVLSAMATLGYCSRGVAFGVVGCLFVWAAATHDAKESAGLDQALSRLLDAPLGPVLLAVVAVGFVCYGAYNIVLARYHR